MSISLVAEPYGEKYWCKIREWDGIDQPQRHRVFEITEDEVDFKGGRFKKMRYSSYGFESKIVLSANNDETPINEVITWISENIKKIWHFDISMSWEDCYDGSQYYDMVWVFHFKNEEDAVAFKLRWM